MGKWKQVSGDMTWERHGAVLAMVEPGARQVQLVRIEPWIEHDREAAVTHGLYLVDEKTVDYDDLSVESRQTKGAIDSVGMDVAEYKKLSPAHKAEALASYEGYEDSRSVNSLADALPAPVEEIEFWGGKETADKLAAYDEELRREVLDANFDTRLNFGDIPEMEALEFALGGEGLEMDLKGQDALAFEYAMLVAGTSGDTGSAETVAETLQALAAAPRPGDLEEVPQDAAESVKRWADRYGDPDDDEEGIAASAASVASSMVSVIGFEWV